MSQSENPSQPSQVEKRLNPKRDWEAFVERQVKEQTGEHSYPFGRKLDFSPFEAELEALDAADIERIEKLTQSATIPELQAEMVAGRLSCEQLTLFYLHRIRQHNPQLRAYLELNPKALEEARAKDQELKAGRPRGALHGIPVCLKDNIATQNMHTTAGAAALKDAIADRDAFIVQKLRQAGAVILGKNNLSEWANFMTAASVNGFSALGGHTRNPYGAFDVGGSSSGTASAVAANLAVAGVGSETSGSLIYPAAQNGIYTLKPTLGFISRDRIIPITDAQDTAGPLVKNATDLGILMHVLTGHDPNDPLTQRAKHPKVSELAGSPAEVSLEGLRVGHIQFTQRKGDQEALNGLAQALRDLGAEVTEIPYPEGKIDMLPVLRYGLREGVNAYLRATQSPAQSLADVIAFNVQHPEAAPYGQDLLVASQEEAMTLEQYRALVDENRRTGTLSLRNLMTEYQVSILLTVSNSLSLQTSTAGFPVLCLPAGYRESGEPIGASLVGDFLEDAYLISLAYKLEQHLKLRRFPRV